MIWLLLLAKVLYLLLLEIPVCVYNGAFVIIGWRFCWNGFIRWSFMWILFCNAGKWRLQLLQLWCKETGWGQMCSSRSCFCCVSKMTFSYSFGFLYLWISFLLYAPHTILIMVLVLGWILITRQQAGNLSLVLMIEQ